MYTLSFEIHFNTKVVTKYICITFFISPPIFCLMSRRRQYFSGNCDPYPTKICIFLFIAMAFAPFHTHSCIRSVYAKCAPRNALPFFFIRYRPHNRVEHLVPFVGELHTYILVNFHLLLSFNVNTKRSSILKAVIYTHTHSTQPRALRFS